jgi:hypothetical protein
VHLHIAAYTAIQEENGGIFAAYYGEDEAGITYLMGSRFDLP